MWKVYLESQVNYSRSKFFHAIYLKLTANECTKAMGKTNITLIVALSLYLKNIGDSLYMLAFKFFCDKKKQNGQDSHDFVKSTEPLQIRN